MTEEEPTYAHHFTTTDVDSEGNQLTFSLVEGEDGGVYWGYGHTEPQEFVAEVNRWIVHTMGEEERIYSDPAELAKAGATVDHLWAQANGEKGDFELVRDHGNDALKKAADVFPVTRLWL